MLIEIPTQLGQAWWHAPAILALERLWQENQEFRDNLDYRERLSLGLKLKMSSTCLGQAPSGHLKTETNFR